MNATPTGCRASSGRRAFFLALVFFTAGEFFTVRSPAAESSGAAERATGTLSGRVQNEVTGQYLNNARITIKGTDLTTFTDGAGAFHLSNVPAGPVVLQAFYSGLDPQEIALTVPPGRSVERDINLTSRASYGDKPGIVQLDPFVLTTSKLTEGESLATNEQRFAANIKNVVATDAFGDVTEGNVAEFMKYVPGMSVEYVDLLPVAVAVRGLDPNMTNVTTDGGTLANASRNATTRQFDFMQVSINNLSRIEVTKVPTPANAASGISGSVNMVSKSAFERSKAQLNYRLYVSASSDGMMLKKQPFPFDTYEPRVNPGFDFDYTLPLSKNFGLVLTALSSKAWNEQNLSQLLWNATAAGTGGTPAKPYLQTHTIIDAPKWYDRKSSGLKADWRVTPNSVLSVGLQATYYQDINGQVNRATSVGTNAAPAIAGGAPLTFGDQYSRSAMGRGTVTFAGNFLHIDARTLGANSRYRFENGDWRIDTGLNISTSKTWLRFHEKGSFGTFGIALQDTTNARVNLENIRPERPGVVQLFGANNRDLNLNDIGLYRLNTAQSGAYRDHRDDTWGGDLNARRNLKLLGLPAAIQVGALHTTQDREHRNVTRVFTYNPPNPTDPTPTPFLATVYKNRQNYYDFDYLPWVSPNRMVEAWGRNPGLFTQTPAQQVSEEQSRIVGDVTFKESITAAYAQTEARLFRNRLLLLTGVRYEKVHDKASGPLFEPGNVYVRTASGAYARNAAGQRIRRPDAGAVGSMEELRLIRIARGNRVNGAYDGYYPSLHLTYNATEKLLLRAAYARTYGRPDFSQIIPNATISENDVAESADPSVIRGTITVTNPALKPWRAQNYDLSAEYYTDSGGLLSVGLFRKDITDFFGTRVAAATAQDLEELGLDPRYVGWMLTTTVNVGDARVTGSEFNVRQSLAPLGGWGRYFSVFANATKLKLDGSSIASFTRFIPETVNWGFTVTRNPATLMLKWQYRGEQKQTAIPVMGPDAFVYQEARTTFDVNFTYQLYKRYSLFANGRNVFNAHFNIARYGSQTPDYAKRYSNNSYGVQWAFGIKGTY